MKSLIENFTEVRRLGAALITCARTDGQKEGSRRCSRLCERASRIMCAYVSLRVRHIGKT